MPEEDKKDAGNDGPQCAQGGEASPDKTTGPQIKIMSLQEAIKDLESNIGLARLIKERDLLEQRLDILNNWIRLLQANPEMLEAFEKLSRL